MAIANDQLLITYKNYLLAIIAYQNAVIWNTHALLPPKKDINTEFLSYRRTQDLVSKLNLN